VYELIQTIYSDLCNNPFMLSGISNEGLKSLEAAIMGAKAKLGQVRVFVYDGGG